MDFRNFVVLICAFSVTSAGFAGNAADLNAENRGIVSTISNAISTVSKIPGLGSSSSGACTPESTIPLNLTALQNILPPSMAELVTQENVKTIQNTKVLAVKATLAATGNPAAIVDLLLFLTSSDDPLPGIYEMGKQIIPKLTPHEVSALISASNVAIAGAFGNATEAVSNQLHKLQDGFQNVIGKLNPCKAPAPAPAAQVPVVSAPAA